MMKTLLLLAAFVAAIVLYCNSDEWFTHDPNVDAIHAENAQHARERAAALPPNFSMPDSFAELLAMLASITGSTPIPFVGERDHGLEIPTRAFAFATGSDTVARALADTVNVLARGKPFYLFGYRSGAGIGGSYVVAWPEPHPYSAIEVVGTSGGLFGPDSAEVARWFRALHSEQPFVINAIGRDFIRGRFLTTLGDPRALARRFYKFCPDIVRQGTRSVRALEITMRESMHLYCWWD